MTNETIILRNYYRDGSDSALRLDLTRERGADGEYLREPGGRVWMPAGRDETGRLIAVAWQD